MLFSSRIHASDSSKFCPFEIVYGVKPRLLGDKRWMVAANEAWPGDHELASRIEELNKLCLAASGNMALRAEANKAAFDNKMNFTCNLDALVVG